MSLITETKKLRELEQKAQDAPDWPSPVEEVVYTDALLQHAPAMIDVLESFREGDAELLKDAARAFCYSPAYKPYHEALCRLQKAASLMEQEEREG